MGEIFRLNGDEMELYMDYNTYDAHRAIKRAGHNYLYKKLHSSSPLNGKTALEIYNTFGIPLSIIILIANSHGSHVDEIEFNRLLDIQKEEMRKMILC